MIKTYKASKPTLLALFLFSLINSATTIIILNDPKRIPPVILMNFLVFAGFCTIYFIFQYIRLHTDRFFKNEN